MSPILPRLPGLIACLGPLLTAPLAIGQTPTAQVNLTIAPHPTTPGAYQFTAPAVAGRVYFFQMSTDYETWTYCPTVKLEPVNTLLVYNVCQTTNQRYFCRLKYTTETTYTQGATGDIDNDGLSNWDELSQTFTDPLNPDTDSDGMADGWEVAHQFNPLVDDGASIQDPDFDQLTNLEEFQISQQTGLPFNPRNSHSFGPEWTDYEQSLLSSAGQSAAQVLTRRGSDPHALRDPALFGSYRRGVRLWAAQHPGSSGPNAPPWMPNVGNALQWLVGPGNEASFQDIANNPGSNFNQRDTFLPLWPDDLIETGSVIFDTSFTPASGAAYGVTVDVVETEPSGQLIQSYENLSGYFNQSQIWMGLSRQVDFPISRSFHILKKTRYAESSPYPVPLPQAPPDQLSSHTLVINPGAPGSNSAHDPVSAPIVVSPSVDAVSLARVEHTSTAQPFRFVFNGYPQGLIGQSNGAPVSTESEPTVYLPVQLNEDREQDQGIAESSQPGPSAPLPDIDHNRAAVAATGYIPERAVLFDRGFSQLQFDGSGFPLEESSLEVTASAPSGTQIYLYDENGRAIPPAELQSTPQQPIAPIWVKLSSGKIYAEIGRLNTASPTLPGDPPPLPAQPATLTVTATFQNPQNITNGQPGTLSLSRTVILLPVEVVTKSAQDPATAMSVDGVGLTNQPPVVELTTVGIGQVSMSGNVATVPISGIIRDAFMDNVAPGKGADITKATVFVNGEEDRVINLTRQSDGAAALWRNYPAKITIPSIYVTVPASGIASIRVETEANAAGIKGSDEIIVEFTEHRQPGPRVGAYTREYFLTCPGAFTATGVNTLTLRVGSASTIYTLTETGPDTLLFKSPAPVAGQPIPRQFAVQMLTAYSAQTTQVETIQCHLTDSEFVGGFRGSAQPHLSCTETGANTGVFRFFESEPGIIGSYSVTHSVASMTKPPAASLIGNHPFSFRLGGGLADPANKFKLGPETFDTVTLNGFTYPKLDASRQINAYLIWNEALVTPRKELLYYDGTTATLKRIPITDEATDLKAKLVLGTQTTDLLTIKSGSLTFVGADGLPIEEINRVSVQTLVDLINGDDTVVIEDDSWEKIRVRPIAKPEELTVRIKSSEIETDYFDLKVNPTGGGKQARLVPVADGQYESELKIVVYYSDEGITTLSEEQWAALKELGYLAVHNTNEIAAQIILNNALDDIPGAALQEHHIFPQFNGSDPRYSKFFAKVFDPGEFDIHDFTVPVAQVRHSRFSNQWDRAWKDFINEYTDANGNLLPNKMDFNGNIITKQRLKREILDHALHPDSGLCRIYNVDASRVVRFHEKLGGLTKRTSTVDRLLRIDSFDGDPKLNIPGDPKSRRWKQLVGATGKKGLRALKKLRHVGAVVAVFTLINSGPKAAAAEALGITPSGVDALLEGDVTMGIEFWDPGGSVKQAELLDGTIVREGAAYYWAWTGANGLVGHVDHGEVDYLIATATPGVVHVVVKFGSEKRTYYDIRGWKTGMPEEGQSWPPGW